MNLEEFLESRREHLFAAAYTDEETLYWMEQAALTAKKNASGRMFPTKIINEIDSKGKEISDKNKNY